MQAFDYVMTLMSFVYALAIAHVLATAGDIIGAWSRVRFSWLNAAWMLFELFAILAWWIGLWGARHAPSWSTVNIAQLFVLATLLYLEARIICMRVPAEGVVDMKRFHSEESRKYITIYVVLAAITVVLNIQARGGYGVDVANNIAKNYAVLAIFVLSVAGAILSGRRAQTAVAVGLFAPGSGTSRRCRVGWPNPANREFSRGAC
jgi:hypothetical protein